MDSCLNFKLKFTMFSLATLWLRLVPCDDKNSEYIKQKRLKDCFYLHIVFLVVADSFTIKNNVQRLKHEH